LRPSPALSGIGPKLGEALRRLLVGGDGPEARVVDLLFHLPVAVIDRSQRPGVAEAAQGAIVTLKVRVDRHAQAPRGNRRIPWRVYASDDTGEVAPHLLSRARGLAGEDAADREDDLRQRKNGLVQRPSRRWSIPDHIVSEAELDELPLIEPIYPMTAGLSSKVLLRAVGAAIERLPQLDEWLDAALLAQRQWPRLPRRSFHAHRPDHRVDVDANTATAVPPGLR
jgi:ATP-dependent DNA helicase RecG